VLLLITYFNQDKT